MVLIRDSRFWVALVLLVKTVLFYLLPDFPAAIWQAVDGLITAVLAILVGNNVVAERRAARAALDWQ